MLNKEKVEVHLHLWYEDVSIYLLKKLKKHWDGRINISLLHDSESNKNILDFASDNFQEVNTVYVPNRGTDQNGFFASYQNHSEGKDWIFYAHDKSNDKLEWIDQITDPLLEQEKTVNKLMQDENSGIISSGNPVRLERLRSEEDLIALDKTMQFHHKHRVVLCRQTLIWLRELQYILYEKHGLINKNNLNFKFTAGTMFLIDKRVLTLVHDCIHENFFPAHYREDGDMPHALERFYFYVSICLEQKNHFI